MEHEPENRSISPEPAPESVNSRERRVREEQYYDQVERPDVRDINGVQWDVPMLLALIRGMEQMIRQKEGRMSTVRHYHERMRDNRASVRGEPNSHPHSRERLFLGASETTKASEERMQEERFPEEWYKVCALVIDNSMAGFTRSIDRYGINRFEPACKLSMLDCKKMWKVLTMEYLDGHVSDFEGRLNEEVWGPRRNVSKFRFEKEMAFIQRGAGLSGKDRLVLESHVENPDDVFEYLHLDMYPERESTP